MSIKRHPHPRGAWISSAVEHNDTVYLCGFVAEDPKADVATQTRQVLERIDKALAACGTDKSKLLQAQIWVSDIRTFGEMNAVWEAWVAPGTAPTRACVEARLGNPLYKVEIMAIAAK